MHEISMSMHNLALCPHIHKHKHIHVHVYVSTLYRQ